MDKIASPRSIQVIIRPAPVHFNVPATLSAPEYCGILSTVSEAIEYAIKKTIIATAKGIILFVAAIASSINFNTIFKSENNTAAAAANIKSNIAQSTSIPVNLVTPEYSLAPTISI